MGDNGSWIMRKRSDANQVDRPTEYAPVQPQQEAIVSCHFSIVVIATDSGFRRIWRFWVNPGSATSLATTPFPTRSNSSSPSGRSSPALHSFCFFSLCLVPDLPALRFPALVISSVFLALGVAKPCLARVYMGNRRTLVVFRLPEVGAFRSTSQRRSSWLLALPTTSMGCKAWRPAASASILSGVEWRE